MNKLHSQSYPLRYKLTYKISPQYSHINCYIPMKYINIIYIYIYISNSVLKNCRIAQWRVLLTASHLISRKSTEKCQWVNRLYSLAKSKGNGEEVHFST